MVLPQDQKAKIIRIIARLNIGGPARHVAWLTAGLPKERFQSILICGSVSSGEGDMTYFAAENGIEPVTIPEMSRELSIRDFVSLWKIFCLLRLEKPDIIHTHTAKAGALGRVAGFAYKWLTLKAIVGKPRPVRVVHTYHGHVFHSYYGKYKTFFFLTIEKFLARLATNRILVLSEQQRREIYNDFGVGRKEQFRIVPLGIDLWSFMGGDARRNVFRDELKAGADEILVGIVGRLTEIKNHRLFLKIAQLWREQKFSDLPRVRFIIVGDGHLRANLEQEARELNLIQEHLIFVGERKDPEFFYPALDIVALTSLNEGTPLTLIEAMANARPVISTAVGGVVDLVGAKTSQPENFEIALRGVAVASGNVAGFVAGLRLLVENKKLREEFGKFGEKFVRANYSKERLIDDMVKLYEDLLSD